MATLRRQTIWCRRAQRAGVVLMVLILGGFLLLAYRPQIGKLGALRGQIEQRKTELDAARSRARTLPMVMAEVARLQQRLERFDKRLPKQQELGQFIKDITQLSQHSSLRKWSIQKGSTRRTELYSELPITLRFEGDFLDVYAFLRNTEEMQRLTRVKSVQFRNIDTGLGQVDVQVAMSIYFSEG